MAQFPRFEDQFGQYGFEWMTRAPGRFLYGPDYQPPANTGEMDYHLEEMRKITQKQIRSDEKLGYFWWIVSWIALNGENAVWVVGIPGVILQKIEKNTLNFKAKSWWTLARHRLCPTTGDNILSPV
ncbi:hypothetical protein FXO38_13576 [Capsicum annuum]|nr:hypothetical protein FXO38_13576 [Capsicum annuum]KAF3660236.1 hypothetical protein FXO37_13587 [Capsicum annuum]